MDKFINKNNSCCWDSRSYFSHQSHGQTSLMYDTLRQSYRPLSRIAVISILSMAISDVENMGMGSLRRRGTWSSWKL